MKKAVLLLLELAVSNHPHREREIRSAAREIQSVVTVPAKPAKKK